MLCAHNSINELNDTNKSKTTSFNMLYNSKEYVPRTHGIRDCIIDTDYNQIKEINKSVILKAKENKLFRKNTVDGLTVMAWDGIETNETTKEIQGLPEREYKDLGEIRKYIKYTCGMNVGPIANILIISKQHLEVEKIETKTGITRAKTIGETTAFQSMWKESEKIIGSVIDVHVFDALYLDQNVTNLINDANKYFVIRLKDENRNIYEDAEGLFNSRNADSNYEVVEYETRKIIKYSKKAKKKDAIKKKIKIEKRATSNNKLGEKIKKNNSVIEKKNSTVKIEEFEKVIKRKEVWSDEFELTGYKSKVRVIKSVEKSIQKGKEQIQVLWVVTNMINHDIETILKIMHLRWNIENCGFRTLKQRYKINHIFIGEINAINYMVQIIFLAFNLLELYMKIRLKEKVKITWIMLKKIFESQLHDSKELGIIFKNTS